ncbi:Na(+)/H(+) antiporter subunit B [Bacillus massiliigorillae]|uniref:Na(+)/H(+) antiporter subunit B n=1 Tax=Bacillus massiliigorillae TaxID=1243664 RepID=UPI0003A6474E|nr:Na(+)/H(+) antiporter subunit B [Bacillus massiliigorillae]
MKTNDIILQTATKVIAFVIILFSIRLFFSGHYYAGGGFVGGLMTSAALVLIMIAFDMKTVEWILPINYRFLIGIGLLTSVSTGLIGVFMGDPFLTHYFGYFDLPILGKTSLHTAALFDLGVYFVVVGVTMTIIKSIGESE